MKHKNREKDNVGRGCTHPYLLFYDEVSGDFININHGEENVEMENQNVETIQETEVIEQEPTHEVISVNGEDTLAEIGSEEAEMAKVKNLFGLGEMLNSVKLAGQETLHQRTKVLGEGKDHVAEHLDKLVAELTIDQIKALTPDELTEAFTMDAGVIEVQLNFETPEEVANFRREFLVYMKESSIALARIDEETNRLEADLDASREEFNQLIAEFGDFDNYISTKLVEKIAEKTASGDVEGLQRLQTVQQAYTSAITLDIIIEHYKQFSTWNTIAELKSPSRSLKVYTKYKDKLKQLRIKTDLAEFDNVERFLPEKYQGLQNYFLFAVIKYIGYRPTVEANNDGVFVAQVAVNVRSLMTDSFSTEEKKQRFIDSICELLDLFI